MLQERRKHGLVKVSTLFLIWAFTLTGCSGSSTSDLMQAGEDTMQAQINQESSADSSMLQEESEVRDGTHEDTLATPSDFPESYDYGSGRYTDWDYSGMNRRLPEPENNETVLNTTPDLTKIQALYLWEDGNFPTQTEVTRANFDPIDFRPYLTAIPVREGTEVKGAVIQMCIRDSYKNTRKLFLCADHFYKLSYGIPMQYLDTPTCS